MLSCLIQTIPRQGWNPISKCFVLDLVHHCSQYLPPCLPIISIPVAFYQCLHQHFICMLLIITKRVLSQRFPCNQWLQKVIAVIWFFFNCLVCIVCSLAFFHWVFVGCLRRLMSLLSRKEFSFSSGFHSAGLKIMAAYSPVKMTDQTNFSSDIPCFWPVKS